MDSLSFLALLEKALQMREPLLDPAHRSAFRLFNGFREGNPDIVIDLYASTLVIYNYAENVGNGLVLSHEAQTLLTRSISWLRAGIIKIRNGKTPEEKRGQLLFGEQPDRKIQEDEIWYAIDLTMNRDTSFYLDTRHLRRWLIENMSDKSVLNTFAYTGSLGVAATAGKASRVVQLDLNRRFLSLAKESYALNSFPIRKEDFIAADFFPTVSRFKRENQLFDCVIIDPPFFSSTPKGRVDQVHESARLINKVRPLINDGGMLVAINNALYVSGKEYMQILESLCRDGYLSIRELVDVPEDVVGFHRLGTSITDPSPFNYATKIAILDVKRKV